MIIIIIMIIIISGPEKISTNGPENKKTNDDA